MNADMDVDVDVDMAHEYGMAHVSVGLPCCARHAVLQYAVLAPW